MYEAQSISIPPKLRWFVRRTDDVYVPLIAVDELPPDIELIGAPRVMEQDMIEGLKFVGAVEHSGKFFSFRRTSECSRDQYQRNDKGHTSSKAASSNPRKSEPGEERPSILTEHSHHEQFCKLSPQIIPQETLSITYINHPQDSPSKDLRPVTASRTVPTPSLVHSKESTVRATRLLRFNVY
ncbi:hypothetical protein M501DRAFT_671124 [Patellaria atrata CBS 101060]|uniref:Uncharacterized protein n=1 Tax=Patellaria atrata CBS 101060 TaxID=1346257 RepID=A0A9P4SDZ4_9PEZI|nr:hypothetical protein M501DRAFT_671124 [Patellaria atrata CBS 101060]